MDPWTTQAASKSTPVWGLGWTLEVEYGTIRNVDLTFYTHHRSILHRLAIIHSDRDRHRHTDGQSDHNRPTVHLLESFT